MPSVLITGANRGLGLEFARQYCEDGHRVFAACRDPDTAEELRRLSGDRLSVHRLDVGDPASIERLADELSEPSIDILINNAGINGPKRQRFGDIDYPGFEHTLRINTLGPLRVCEAFVDNVARSDRKLMVAITSGMGSIEDNTSGGSYAYRTSKAALNIVMRNIAVDLKKRGIIAVVINPRLGADGHGRPRCQPRTAREHLPHAPDLRPPRSRRLWHLPELPRQHLSLVRPHRALPVNGNSEAPSRGCEKSFCERGRSGQPAAWGSGLKRARGARRAGTASSRIWRA